jgi:hypothetical protein
MLSKKTMITILGALVAVSPFLGLPSLINTSLLFICGILIIIIARTSTKKVVTKKII